VIGCCRYCLYYKPNTVVSLSERLGECRRHAPRQMGDELYTDWGLTESNDWCGDYQDSGGIADHILAVKEGE
jgi:hypothetical protein